SLVELNKNLKSDISVKMNRLENDLVLNYELLNNINTSNKTTEEALDFDKIDSDECKKAKIDNTVIYRYNRNLG
ncbi:33031_t:CDS:2, partial [Gigaspora margarita]